jgi:hypothetical protein
MESRCSARCHSVEMYIRTSSMRGVERIYAFCVMVGDEHVCLITSYPAAVVKVLQTGDSSAQECIFESGRVSKSEHRYEVLSLTWEGNITHSWTSPMLTYWFGVMGSPSP